MYICILWGMGGFRRSRLIFYLNLVLCFESNWYSSFNFYKNNFYQPCFFIFWKVLFSFVMHLFNYVYKTLKLK